MSEIKKIVSDAEVKWGSYNPSCTHKIQEEIKENGIYDSHNFYEFCKGYFFATKDLEQTIQRQAKEIELLEKCVEFYSNQENWNSLRKSDPDFMNVVKHDDLEFWDDTYDVATGGKIARQTKQELEKLRSGE